MESSRCFDLLIEHVNRSESVFADFKVHVLSELQYFKLQSLCDYNRRHDPLVLQNRWVQLSEKIKKSKLFDSFNQGRDFWSEIDTFVGRKSPATPAVPRAEPRINKANPELAVKDLRATWEADTFFKNLHEKAGTVRELKSLERTCLLIGLKYLETEAKRQRLHRDQKAIRFTWEALHPLLEKHQLLAPYKSQPEIKNHVRYFVTEKL